jgi:hypothetical protein
MIENTHAMLLGARDDLVKSGPAVLVVSALMWATFLTLYGIGWVMVHITAYATG